MKLICILFYCISTDIYIISEILGIVKGINLISVSHNGSKVDIFKTIDSLGIKNGEVIIRNNYNKELLININTKDIIGIDIDYLKNKLITELSIKNINNVFDEPKKNERAMIEL